MNQMYHQLKITGKITQENMGNNILKSSQHVFKAETGAVCTDIE